MPRWIYNFLKGMTRIVDPFSLSDETKKILNWSDAEAIRSDWQKVMADWNKSFQDAWDDPEMDIYNDK